VLGKTAGREFFGTKRPREKAALVVLGQEVDEKGAGQRTVRELHA
jgi:hypothetical protein